MRADAAATLYVAGPLRRLLPGPPRVPILMYHSISDRSEDQRHPYFRTITSPRVFAAQMRHLHAHGYTTLKVGEVAPYLADPTPGRKPFVITFDDGFEDVYSQAFPILNQYGFSAIVYLPTAYIGTAPRDFLGTPCMTWGQVRELRAQGLEFGSHTVNHPQLNAEKMRPDDVRHEIQDSKDSIEQALGYPVTSFAYPYAFPETDRGFTGSLREMLVAAGYQNGVCTVIGRAGGSEDPYFRKRIPINSCDDARLLQAKLEGGYDWLRPVQYAAKFMKGVGRRPGAKSA